MSELPTLDGRYCLARLLARGGMAEIYLARQRTVAGPERQVAVKLLQSRFLDEARVLEMFRREVEIGLLMGHPHVVHVYDAGMHDGLPYLVMEYVPGEELQTLCRQGVDFDRFLPLEHAVELMRQVAHALAFVHSKRSADGAPLGIVHRDVSPSNILVTPDGSAKLIDFGVACTTADATRGAQPGKPNYMAPEQARGEVLDHRADLFSLGVVLYEITVGRRLFTGRPEDVLRRIGRPRITPPSFSKRDYPPALESIVMRALEAHPDDRYHSAYELAEELEQFLHDAGLRSGHLARVRYLDALATTASRARRSDLASRWDDDGPEALDFDRGRETTRETGEVPVAASPPLAAPSLGFPWFVAVTLTLLSVAVGYALWS